MNREGELPVVAGDVESPDGARDAHEMIQGVVTCALPGTPLAAARAGIDTCVHCGFCLPACPTYHALEDENDSPRGRIMIMRSLLEGTLDVHDPAAQTHIDRCLGCRGCETACPSGVPYGQLLEATRATFAQFRDMPRVARIILWVFERPRLLAAALAASRFFRATRLPALLSRLGTRVGWPMAMLSSTSSPVARRPYTPRGTGARGRTAVLTGCVMEGLYTETNRATERVLIVNDYDVVGAPGQRCCGALHAHAGDLDAARRLARANIAAFERAGARYVAVNSAGCGAAMKEYGHLLRDDPAWAERAARVAATVRDVSELLAAAGPKVPPAGAVALRVTYDHPCHLIHAQRLSAPPLTVLAAIPGLELVPLDGAEHCCGAAGIYNLIEPETAAKVLAPKLRNIAATEASLVATGNPGCLMQIGGGLRQARQRARVVHPADLLDAAYGASDQERARPARG